ENLQPRTTSIRPYTLRVCGRKTTVCRIFSCQRTLRFLTLALLSSWFLVLSESARKKLIPLRTKNEELRTDASVPVLGGEYRARTGDLLVANQALSQLS